MGGSDDELPALAKLGIPVGYGADPIALDSRRDVAWVGETEAKAGQPAEDLIRPASFGRSVSRKVAAGDTHDDVPARRPPWRLPLLRPSAARR